MQFKYAIFGLTALLLLLTPYVSAEEENSISANVTLVSDYSFRGVSQTGLLPAIQGGFDIETDAGFFIWHLGIQCQLR